MRTAPLAAVLVGLALVLSACGGEGGPVPPAAAEAPADPAADTATPPAPGTASAAQALAEGRTVIDVRTAAEVAQGAVPGALHLDVSAPTFAADIAALDAADSYVVYCRTGNRSAAATAQMRALGLDVLDGGGLDAMAAAGFAIG
ncbi:MAG TPA: rhodanese-like domain-containing protein [Acidimicrobiales bacterium]|nr:rhodanese-like domain-containing protein [Acidimicrobiales bacterium]